MRPQRFMNGAVGFAVRRPLVTLALALAAAVAGVALAAARMEIRTSNLDLVSSDLPVIGAFNAFAEEFGTPNTLILVLEGSDPAALRAAVDRLAAAFKPLPGVLAVVARDPGKSSLLYSAEERYLTSDDGELYFVFIQPDDPRSSAATIEPFVRRVRETVEAADLASVGIQAGLTGLPQYALDDRTTIENDISTLSLVAFSAILALFAAAFRSLLRPMLAMVALVVGVAATLGVASGYPGHLTLLSAFFASILFGLGIDAGIHIISHFETLVADGETPAEAAVAAVSEQAPALWTGALTTSSAFLTMNLTDFSGFAELGTIAGAGMLLCLLAMITVLPALLVLRGGGQRTDTRPPGLFDRALAATLRALRASWIAPTFGILTLACVFVPGPKFDSDYLNLQPLGSETVRLEREMVERSAFSPVFAGFTVDSVEEVEALTERLQDIEGVGAVRSIRDAMRAALAGNDDEIPKEMLSRLKGKTGRYAVYAYPSENVWEVEAQQRFIASMKGLDAEVTGMPFVSDFMAGLSQTAMHQCAAASAVLLVLLVWLSFRDLTATAVVAAPVVATVVATRAVLSLLGMSMNPLAIMAWPVILGIAVDDSIHMTHRFHAEGGDLEATMAGTGRSVTLTSLTTIAAFGALGFTAHRGLSSFGMTVAIGVTIALLLSLSLLPRMLKGGVKSRHSTTGVAPAA